MSKNAKAKIDLEWGFWQQARQVQRKIGSMEDAENGCNGIALPNALYVMQGIVENI